MYLPGTLLSETSPLRIAHRCVCGVEGCPENSIPALERCWDHNEGAEVDVWLTRDGELVCFHDDTTARLAPDQAPLEIEKSDLASLRKIRLGEGKFAGTRIPTLEEVLDALPRGKRLFLDLKPAKSLDDRIVDPLIALLKAKVASGAVRMDQVTCLHFRPEIIAKIKSSFPALEVLMLVHVDWAFEELNKLAPTKVRRTEDVLPFIERLFAGCKADGFSFAPHVLIAKEQLRGYEERGIPWHMWRIKTVEEAERYTKWGARSLTTDISHLLEFEEPAGVGHSGG